MAAIGNSRIVTTNQLGPNPKIPELVERYLRSQSRKPIPQHSQRAFDFVSDWLGGWATDGSQPLILDACCGVGKSSIEIALRYPQAKVIGVDKSKTRIEKRPKDGQLPANCLLVRADIADFWRLANAAKWRLSKHFLLFPNPYPKALHVQRRWHGSPSFVDIVRLGGTLELRSNWQLYLQEFAIALDCIGVAAQTTQLAIRTPLSAFERKYHASGQAIWQLTCELPRLALAEQGCDKTSVRG